MSEDLEALLTTARRREHALTAVLRAVTSGNDLQTVLLDIAAAASQLFDAKSAGVFVLEGDEIGMYAEFASVDGEHRPRGRWPRPNERTSSLAEVLRDRCVIRFDDQSSIGDEYAQSRDAAAQAGIKSSVYVPAPTGGAAVGMCVFRGVIDPFTDDDVALLQSFATQAAHAVESARRADELAARNTELAEALQLQTAASEVLGLIGEHPGDLQRVLNGIIRNAVRLCGADRGVMLRTDGLTATFVAASYGLGPVGRTFTTSAVAPSDRGRREVRFIPDAAAYRAERGLPEELLPNGAAILVPVPGDGGFFFGLLNDDGTEFQAGHATIMQSFAAQARVAIDNAALFNDLAESLALQTATSEVLRLISANPGDLSAVFQGIVQLAADLCDARGGSAQRFVGDELEFIAHNLPGAQQMVGARVPAAFITETSGPTFIDDIHELMEVASPARSLLSVPLVSGDEIFGRLMVSRFEVRPFEERHARILQAFADQAAIAITNAGLFNDLDESLELQRATSEVLRIISEHPGDLPAVFNGIVQQAAALCDADSGVAHQLIGDEWEFIAVSSQESQGFIGTRVPRTSRANPTGPTFIDDLREIYGESMPARSSVGVPLYSEGTHFGQLSLSRLELRPFDQHHGEILQRFADQASIAISNAKLFNSLDSALTRQTANAEILRVISTSPGDVGRTLREIHRAAIALVQVSHLGVTYGADHSFSAWDPLRGFQTITDRERLGGDLIVDQTHATGLPMQLVGPVEEWRAENPFVAERTAEAGFTNGTTLFVPMAGSLGKWGFLIAQRTAPVAFDTDEIAILQGFAAHAVIAIDNAELLSALETRNVELGESLELQTATSEVLRLISDHPGDLHAVMQGLVERAVRLLDADQGGASQIEGHDTTYVVADTVSPEVVGVRVPLSPVLRQVIFSDSAEPVMFDDVQQLVTDGLATPQAVQQVRSGIVAPLFADGRPFGALRLGRFDVRPFTEDDARVFRVFVEQATIAISNAKLFNDLDAALERQTAMTEVLDEVGRARTDLTPMFDVLARHANRLCGGTGAIVLIRAGDDLTALAGAASSADDHLRETILGRRWAIGSGTPSAEAAATGRTIHVDDWANIAIDRYPDSPSRREPGRSVLAVPMVRDAAAVGVLTFTRATGRYRPAEISLLEAFANQAAIAVDNARLLREIEDRNSDLAESLELQTATSDVLRLISSHPGDLHAVMTGLVERATRLVGADQGSAFRNEGDAVTFLVDTVYPDQVGATYQVAPEMRSAFEKSSSPMLIDDIQVLVRQGIVSPEMARDLGSCLSVPLWADGELYGSLNLNRFDVRPYTDDDARIVTAFAEQASIAISNARLFNDLDAALTRQTANAEILRVISTSPGDLGRTLPEIALAARRLTSAFDIAITYGDDSGISVWDEPRGFRTMDAAIRVPGSNQLLDSVRATRRAGQLVGPVEQWFATDPFLASLAHADGIVEGVVLLVPMQGSMGKTGFILARRKVPVLFSAEEIAMLEEFTAQAVIAFDNADLLAALESRNNDLAESLELQTATSEVLTLISANPGDLRVVLDGIAARAGALCGATVGGVLLVRGDVLRFEGVWPESNGRETAVGREVPIAEAGVNLKARDQRSPVFVDDFSTFVRARNDAVGMSFDEFNTRSFVTIAMFRDETWIGNINLNRTVVDPFDAKVGPILQAFADQAVLAIQNADLFHELEQRNREVKAALEQQTAVGAVLQTISRSAFDLGAVLNELAEQANRLVGGFMTAISLLDGDSFVYPSEFRTGDGRADARYNGLTTPDVIAFYRRRKRPFYPTFDTPESTSAMDPSIRLLFDRFGPFCNANVPLMQGENVLGIIAICRLGLDQFNDSEKRLLQTFADQAVIAIENARLFRELEERNREVSEALEQQTAIAEVLEIISSSPTDLEPVLSQVLGIAAGMCEAEWGLVWQARGERFEVGATHGFTDEEVASMEDIVYRVGEAHVVQQSADGATRRADLSVEVIDAMDVDSDDPTTKPTNVFVQRFRAQSYLLVPLTRPGSFSGVFSLMRKDQRPFSARDEAIVQTFADQALIAIENSRLFHELEDSNREVRVALEQQTAVGAVLQTISRSAFDLGTVLEELSRQATLLVGGQEAAIIVVDTGEMTVFPPEIHRADGSAAPEFNGWRDPETVAFFVERGRPHYAGYPTSEAAAAAGPVTTRHFDVHGVNSMATLPLMQGSRVVGLLAVLRLGVERFTDAEKRLLQTFADQAVIAIENARLFRELEERNREVSEALEQQTAIAEVLEIISSSPTELEPVLNQVLGIAARLCDADIGLVWQRGDDRYVVGASHGLSPEQVAGANDSNFEVGVPHVVEVVADGQLLRFDYDLDEFLRSRSVNIESGLARDDGSTLERDDQLLRPSLEFLRHVPSYAYLMVPLTRPGSFAGVFSLMRWDRRPFSERDEAIVQTFADQAVIAIENSRLFHELEESNREVNAALSQQTAVASVLQTISRSAFDLDVVLNELVEQAHRLVPSIHVAIRGLDGHSYGTTYVHPISDLDHYQTPGTAVLGDFEESVIERNRLIATTVGEHNRGVSSLADSGLDRWGTHSVVCVPMRSSSGVVGLLSVLRRGERRFTDAEKQVLQTFADQAVIAIENSRLFRELEESNREVSAALEQQTAVAAVLQTISRSAFDLDTVLNELADQANRLVQGSLTGIALIDTGKTYTSSPDHRDGDRLAAPWMVNMDAAEMFAARGRPSWVTYADGNKPWFDSALLRRLFSELGPFCMGAVPLTRERGSFGVICVYRAGLERFTDSEKQLLQTFADQAVIAVENARLFSELQAKTEELEIASRHKSEFLANMSHELRTPLNAIIGYSELIAEECDDIGAGELIPDLGKIQSAGKHLLTLISGILDLAKVEAGRMDLFIERVDIVAMATEVDQIVRPLVEKNRNTFTLVCPADIGAFVADLVKVKQVLFNLLSNSAKFTDGGTITLAIAHHSESIEFAITDTGIGMSDEQMGRLFEAFSQADVSTTRKYGGTGLGLALSRSFCQMMGGDITVTSELGVGSTFTVTLPVTQQDPS